MRSLGGRLVRRFRTNDGQLVIGGVVSGNTILAYLPSGAVPSRVSTKIYAVVKLVEMRSGRARADAVPHGSTGAAVDEDAFGILEDVEDDALFLGEVVELLADVVDDELGGRDEVEVAAEEAGASNGRIRIVNPARRTACPRRSPVRPRLPSSRLGVDAPWLHRVRGERRRAVAGRPCP